MEQVVTDRDGCETKFPPLKGRDRASEKAEDDYSKRNPGPGEAWLFDIVRGSVICEDGHTVAAVVRELAAHPAVHAVVKFKNRFKSPTEVGFRDAMLVFSIKTKAGFEHTCEVQVHLRAVKEYGLLSNSHWYYEYFRSFFAGSMETVAKRLADLERILTPDVLESAAAATTASSPSLAMSADRAWLHHITTALIEAEDAQRLEAFARLMREYLSELELALYIYEQLANQYKREYGPEDERVGSTLNAMAIVLKVQEPTCLPPPPPRGLAASRSFVNAQPQ